MSDPDVLDWLKNIQPTEACINAIMGIIAPDLYQRGVETAQKIRAHREELFQKAVSRHGHLWYNGIREVLDCWPSAASGIGVIANRITPSHRDDSDHKTWYDFLVAAGSYTDATFRLPEVKASFKYTPGCLLALCGRLLRHECLGWEGHDRICIAHFFRYEVQERLKPSTIDPDWVKIEPILKLCDRQFQQDNWAAYHSGKVPQGH